MNSHMNRLVGNWLHPDGYFVYGTVEISGGKISQVAEGAGRQQDAQHLPARAFILPGFIDIQINGGFGIDFREQPSGVKELSRRLPEYGVTSFLPTVVTSPLEHYTLILSEITLQAAENGAIPLGLHLEGPFLNPIRKGAHPAEWLRPPDPALVEPLLREGLVRLVTIAAEMEGGKETLDLIRRKGIVASIGHSNATYEQAKDLMPGLGYGTHLFNAMPPLHHRQPGLIAALLEPDAPPAGIIADGVHVHPAMIRLAYRSKGGKGITLVSDASTMAGMPPGTYESTGRQVIIDEDSARLPDGTLAGSIIFLDTAVRNMVRFGCCSLEEAVRMASRTPAEVIGAGQKGRVAQGCDADLVVLDDDLRVYMTMVGGKIVYKRGG